jgi:hypothetical protein
MRGEDQRRLTVVAQAHEAFDGFWGEFDLIHLPGPGVYDMPQPVEVHELGADAAQIVPDTAEHSLDFIGRPFGVSGLQVGAASAVFRQPGADAPQQPGGFFPCPGRVSQPQGLERQQGQSAKQQIKSGLGLARGPSKG